MDLDIFESPGAPDGNVGAELNDVVWVSCPYCGESSELLIDPVGGAIQEYVEDCEVCCHPWLVCVTLNGEGHATGEDFASVSVTTLDDE